MFVACYQAWFLTDALRQSPLLAQILLTNIVANLGERRCWPMAVPKISSVILNILCNWLENLHHNFLFYEEKALPLLVFMDLMMTKVRDNDQKFSLNFLDQ